MKKRSLAFAVLVACGAYATALSPTPTTLKGIPVYPGAVRDTAGEKLLVQKGRDENSKKPDFAAFDALRFTTGAAAEDVLLWYLGAFGLNPGKGSYGTTPGEIRTGPGITEDKLKSDDLPGTASQVGWGIDALRKYAEGEFDSSMNDYMLAMYAAKRKQIQGVWVRNGFLWWSCIEKDGNITSFTVTVSDSSFEKYTKANHSYDQKCVISFGATTSLSPKKMAEAARAAQAQTQAAPTAATLPAGEPTAAYLGVPVYPGARYAVDISKGLQAQGQAVFVWASNDSVEAIVSFFEKATGAKRSPISEGGFLVTKMFDKGGGVAVTVLPVKEVPVEDPIIAAAKTIFTMDRF
ncbi:MAG: hypothetical protein NT080_03435 [Spirochaetes bacterium]|nr:hypothetical protein [Spirochaetota bacterium]